MMKNGMLLITTLNQLGDNMSNKIVCDHCGQEKLCPPFKTIPDKWISLRISVTGQDAHKYITNTRDICNDCIHKYQILPRSDEDHNDAADRLWDLFEELAQEAIENV